MEIRYFRHKDIDKQKWDHVVQHDKTTLPYAHSWYLDTIAPGWEALVLNNYKAVMPLTWKRKLGICYLYQPYFTQQLGVFSTTVCTPAMINSFLAAIPKHFRYIDIQLNEQNHPEKPDMAIIKKPNYTLPLNKSYDSIYKDYNRNCRRNIIKAESAGLHIKERLSPGLFSDFVRRHLSHELKDTRNSIYRLLEIIAQKSVNNGTGEILSVYRPEGSLIATGWFLKSVKRLVFQACASSFEGKELQAMYLLVNHMIRKNAGSGMIFDFAGSGLPGVAYFNSTFGAKPSYYPSVHCNRLPRILRILKK